MKTLLLLSCLLVAAASARASELHYLPGGQPTCQSEEQEGCQIGHKVAAEIPAGTPQSDCFVREMAAMKSAAKVPMTDEVTMRLAGLCSYPVAEVTSCFESSLAAARGAGAPVSTMDGLNAVIEMCLRPRWWGSK